MDTRDDWSFKKRRSILETNISSAESTLTQTTSDDDWRNIMFLPFNKKWECLIVVIIILSSFRVTHGIFYGHINDNYNYMAHVLEILYAIDTVLSILHRKMKNHSKKRKFKQKNLFFISIDVLTLLPVFQIYALVIETSHYEVNTYYKDLVRAQILPRLYRVFIYFNKLRNTAGLNQLLVVCLYLTIRILLITLFISCTLYYYQGGRAGNTSIDMITFIYGFRTNTVIAVFISMFVTAGNIFLHNTNGLLGLITPTDIILIIFSSFCGYLFTIMIAYGELTSVYVKKLTRHFQFTWKFQLIENYMDEWELPKYYRDKIVLFYHDFWKRRRGIITLPRVINLLPINLQKDILLDLSWDVLKHSQLFAGEDMAFKKTLSMHIKYRYYLPGDIIFRAGNMRAKMIYINSGIIQVLSDEDDESPILSFSNGTLLGEACCIMYHKTKVILKCATSCEIQTLSLSSFYKTLLLFPDKSKYFRETYRIRLQKANIGLKIIKRNMEMKRHSLVLPETTIKSLKRRWRLISSLSKDAKRAIGIGEFGEIDGVHTSEFLNRFVLTDDVDLKLKAIFLTRRFPFILDPDSDVAICWQYITMLTILAMSILLPMYTCFGYHIFAIEIPIILLDIMYLIDIYVQISTAVKLKQQTIAKMRHIALYRMNELSFLVDVVTALPLDYYLTHFTDVSNLAVRYLKLVRLLKTYRILAFLIKIQDRKWHYPTFMRIIKFTFVGIMMIYFMAALHYSIRCNYYKYCDYTASKESPPSDYLLGRLIPPLFFIATSLAGARINHIIAPNLVMFLFTFLITFTGFMFLNACFSEICALFVLKNKHENEFKGEMNILRNYLVSLHLPKSIFRKLQDYLIFSWQYNRNSKVNGTNSIMSDLPKDMSDFVLKQTIINTYKKIPIFSGLSEKFYAKIYKHTAIFSIPPNTDVLSNRAETKFLRIILRGYCKMYSNVPIDRAFKRTKILSPGDGFPLMEFLHHIPSFLKVVTITAVDLFYLKIEDFHHALQYEHDEMYRFRDALNLHMTEFDKVLTERPGRLPVLLSEEKSYGRGEFFTYTVDDDTVDETEHTVKMEEIDKRHHEKVGKIGKILYYIMLRKTLHPQSKIYFTWEIIMCIITFIWIILTLTTYNIYGSAQLYFDKSGYIRTTMHVILMFDFYVRFHVQYYNKKGLLVTHHYYTAKHYLKTSFATDLLIIIPYKALQLTKIFGNERMYITEMCTAVILKTFRLYHIFGLLSYFQVDSTKRLSTLINVVKFFIIIVVTLLISTNIYLLGTCSFDATLIIYKCPKDSWLSTTFDPEAESALKTFIFAFFIVTVGFTTAVTGSFRLTKLSDILYFLLMVISGIYVRTFFVALITSSGVSGYTSLNQFQQRISIFLKFVKNEAVDEDLIKETINYYEYLFHKTKGRSFRGFAKSFYLSLSITFASTIFTPTLEKVQLFRNISPSFIRALSDKCELTYYKKDTPVIRCNDVQDKLYIVHKGSVKIIVANQELCMLNKGGIFGNFHHRQIRQTIFAVTSVHSELLVLGSDQFWKILKRYPILIERIRYARGLNCEFWSSEYKEMPREIEVGQSFARVVSSAGSTAGQSKIHSTSKSFIKFLIRKVDHNSKWYQRWQQFIDFHLAAISSIFFTYCIFMGPMDLKMVLHIVRYVTDIIYVSKFYFGFRVTYADTESGITITDSKLIAKRYLKSYFILDFFTILPLNLFYLISPYGEFFTYRMDRYLTLNKIARILYVICFYERLRFKLKDVTIIRFCYLIYILTFVIQSLASVWYITWCWAYKCSLISTNFAGDEVKVPITSVYLSNVMSYYYIVNIFTQASFKSIRAQNYTELFVTILLIFVTQYIGAVLTRTVASYLVNKFSTMSSYEYAIQELQQYLSSRELSPSILNKTWQYLLDLWFLNAGQQLPVIIQHSPSYLKQDLMYALYGKHLENHYLFCNTHVDFLRQLVCHLKPCLSFPNHYIVEKNDVDSTMYFIHSGDIEVVEVLGKNTFTHNVLNKDMTFGEAQGLYNIPHAYSYKALSVCSILLLRRCDWIELLDWFPASKEQIYTGATENLMKRMSTSNRSYNFQYDMDFTF